MANPFKRQRRNVIKAWGIAPGVTNELDASAESALQSTGLSIDPTLAVSE
jgi:hypothetical protein